MKRQRGFSLVEMLVAMGIFAVITGFVMANYRAGQHGDELRIAAQLTATVVRRAQTAAIAGAEASFCRGGAESGPVCSGGADCALGQECVRDVPRGYGVRFSVREGEERNLLSFADLDGDRMLTAGELLRTDAVSSGAFVDVVAVSPSAAGVLDITFVPPRASVSYNNEPPAEQPIIAEVTLRHRSTGAERTIRVNRVSGQVSVIE